MRFIQIMEYETERGPEVEAKMRTAMGGTGGPNMVRLAHTRDRDHPNRYVDIVEFTGYQEAMANSARPETDAMAHELAALCTSGPHYRNLDVMLETPA